MVFCYLQAFHSNYVQIVSLLSTLASTYQMEEVTGTPPELFLTSLCAPARPQDVYVALSKFISITVNIFLLLRIPQSTVSFKS